MASDSRKPYWCEVCKKMHRRTSMIGHEHEKFDGLFVKVRFASRPRDSAGVAPPEEQP
jgi:hypothetical protein